jgi:hypothetical protein
LNHWPVIGAFIGLGIYIVALAAKSEDLRHAGLALFAALALLTIPAYLSGNAAQLQIREMPEVSKDLMQNHEGAALVAFLSMEITGILALFGLWKFSRSGKPEGTAQTGTNSFAVLVFALLTAGLMGVAGNTGGDIRHPEILEDASPGSAVVSFGLRLVALSQYFIIESSRWVWPLVEDMHFLGLILLLGGVGVLNLRMLGLWKQLPIGPLHRFLPWAIAGFFINVVTGFLFFIGMPYFYVFNWIFQLKILVIVFAGANLLLIHCTGVFRKWSQIGANEDAPALAKLVALSSLIMWIAIIIIGRYIPVGEVLTY